MNTKRKFLLKRLPSPAIGKFESPELITICYDNNYEYCGMQIKGELFYEKIDLINKTTIPLTQQEFINKFRESKKTITKHRYSFFENSDSDNLWYIEKFLFMDLVIAYSTNTNIITDMPQEIKDVLIMEITELKELADINLSDNYGK